MKFRDILQKFASFFKKKSANISGAKKEYSIRTVEVSFFDIPRSVYLVIKKYGWMVFFHKTGHFIKVFPFRKKFTYYKGKTKGFILKYSRKISDLQKSFSKSIREEGLRKSFRRITGYIFFGKGVLRIDKKNQNKNKQTKLYKGIKFTEYELWIQQNEKINEKKIFEKIDNLSFKPKISVILSVFNADEIFLKKAIFSVIYQYYRNWELCIIDNASTKKILKKILLDFEKKDPRIRVIFLNQKERVSAIMNKAAEKATGDFVAFIGQHDTLSPLAFFENIKLLNKKLDLDLIYGDEDKIDENENRFDHNFKPDWSPEFLLSKNYIGNYILVRKAIFDRLSGFRETCEGAHVYDFMLRLSEINGRIGHIPKIIYHKRFLPESVSGPEKEKLNKVGLAALGESLGRKKIKGRAASAEFVGKDNVGIYGIKFNPADYEEKVTIVIPTKDKVSLLERCIKSIKEKTSYSNFDILVVDNNSEEKETFEFLKKGKINFVSIPTEKFNYAKIHNEVMKKVGTELVLFLNNDTEIISPDWLLNMVGTMSLNKKIGAVGAKLLYADKKVQHCGVIVGLSSFTAGHANRMIDYKSPGYQDYNIVLRNYSAVTAACMLTKKSLFEKAGGFDEKNLAVAFNDVDYCLKLIDSGYRVVCNPDALLFHLESKSRGEFKHNLDEPKYFTEKWAEVTKKDPFYNINLSLEDGQFRLGKNE